MRHTLRRLVVRCAELPAGGNGTLSSVSDTVVIVQSGLTAVTAYCAFQAVRLNKEQWWRDRPVIATRARTCRSRAGRSRGLAWIHRVVSAVLSGGES